MFHKYFLFFFVDALVEIVDGDGNPMETQYYNPGSEIELTCIIRNRSHWSTKTIWTKDQQPLDLFHRPTVRLVFHDKEKLDSFSSFQDVLLCCL